MAPSGVRPVRKLRRADTIELLHGREHSADIFGKGACGRSRSSTRCRPDCSGISSDDLNESQRAAVMAPDGYNLILAGPGSGKTRVITYRVAYLIARGVPADSILLVTFTRRAAREMVRRLDTLIGHDAGKVWAGTFHHVGNRLLRRPAKLLGYQPNFTILDSEDQLDLIRLAMDDAGFAGTRTSWPQSRPSCCTCSASGSTPGRPWPRSSPASRPSFSNGFPDRGGRRGLREAQAAQPIAWITMTCSFSGCGSSTSFPSSSSKQAGMFRHILIDEMQDTNALQVEIVETIAASRGGEPDGRGRRRPVDLPVPGRELRQHPQVPGAASRFADAFCST